MENYRMKILKKEEFVIGDSPLSYVVLFFRPPPSVLKFCTSKNILPDIPWKNGNDKNVLDLLIFFFLHFSKGHICAISRCKVYEGLN